MNEHSDGQWTVIDSTRIIWWILSISGSKAIISDLLGELTTPQLIKCDFYDMGETRQCSFFHPDHTDGDCFAVCVFTVGDCIIRFIDEDSLSDKSTGLIFNLDICWFHAHVALVTHRSNSQDVESIHLLIKLSSSRTLDTDWRWHQRTETRPRRDHAVCPPLPRRRRVPVATSDRSWRSSLTSTCCGMALCIAVSIAGRKAGHWCTTLSMNLTTTTMVGCVISSCYHCYHNVWRCYCGYRYT